MVGGKPPGPINDKGLSDEVISGDDAGSVELVAVFFAGGVPEARVMAGGTVVAEDEKFIVVECEGIVFGSASGGIVGVAGVMNIPLQNDVGEGKLAVLGGQGDMGGPHGDLGGTVITPFCRVVGAHVSERGVSPQPNLELVVVDGKGEHDGFTRLKRGKSCLREWFST